MKNTDIGIVIASDDLGKRPHIDTDYITTVTTKQYIQEEPTDKAVDGKQIGGSHYKNKAIQPWTYMEVNFTKEEFIGFLRGNIHKYLDRYKDKNGVEDLEKAKHYLEKLIEIESL